LRFLLFIAASRLAAAGYAGSQACAPCHRAIFTKYMQTGMARSSGPAGSGSFRESFENAAFTDPQTSARYRVSSTLEMQYTREDRRGARQLRWHIGSGSVGRSYATSVDGFLFQAPVSYFSKAARWDLSPGFAGKPNVDLARPIEEACLWCHATGARLTPGTQNKFQDPPFTENGIGCERCHGPSSDHAAGRARSINPARLEPSRRDSVCEQCHLTGAARVLRPGASLSSYQPGGRLSDTISVFVWPRAGAVRAATDHTEQLSRSRCKQASGDRLWCGS
jgi:hypothetical protein